MRLTGYSGEASNLPSDVLQTYLDDVVAGNAIVPVGKVFNIDQIQDAHRAMEDHTAKGKIVATRMLRGESPP